ncbi:SH3 domain-containing protein [Acidovorax sp. DW039]|uniref:SH3 domain-containing protein n=1 Tax=Acidovorax sp. DW039 TaxID=3095606 RepID=UPI0030873021|nr:SH3 domain-containing protein [Acidovorax sp. DW039]
MNWLNPLALATGLALTVALPFGTAQAQSAVTKRSTELRESPADNAPSLGSIPANTQLTRTNERNGPWVKVQTPDGASGWVHNFDMGAANSAAPSGNNNASTGSMRTLGGALGRGGSSTTTPTATAGTRGWGNGKANHAPAGASQDGDDEDNNGGEEAQTPSNKRQQPARPGYSASTGGQASPYQRMPTTTPQQAMPPGMSTYSSGNQNWGNGGSANGWGAPSK